jgi:hypothetical protein
MRTFIDILVISTFEKIGVDDYAVLLLDKLRKLIGFMS